MQQILKLEPRLDATAARQLVAELMAHRGAPLRIDAAAVEIVSALAIEVIISSWLQWQEDGFPFALRAPSAAFQSTCIALGLAPDTPWQPLHKGEAA